MEKNSNCEPTCEVGREVLIPVRCPENACFEKMKMVGGSGSDENSEVIEQLILVTFRRSKPDG
ncbi:MAG: hypothetical protein BBJ57_02015 [Desulfobacterales bacterium PC51MH44]|nr:MAG: hypothetical protein BBJ57_02015 [Desulfobacterales bacterium PC51MH44]